MSYVAVGGMFGTPAAPAGAPMFANGSFVVYRDAPHLGVFRVTGSTPSQAVIGDGVEAGNRNTHLGGVTPSVLRVATSADYGKIPIDQVPVTKPSFLSSLRAAGQQGAGPNYLFYGTIAAVAIGALWLATRSAR